MNALVGVVLWLCVECQVASANKVCFMCDKPSTAEYLLPDTIPVSQAPLYPKLEATAA